VLNTEQMAALRRVVQIKGVVQTHRVNVVRDLLTALPEAESEVDEIVGKVLLLVAPNDEMARDVEALVSACQGEPEAVSHARSLLDMAVMVDEAQPTGRRRGGRAPQSDTHVRLLGS